MHYVLILSLTVFIVYGKGSKTLAQAFRSSQSRMDDGIYRDHEDSGIVISDVEDDEDPIVACAEIPGSSSYTQRIQRAPSI
jgi:hypothetical protein